MAYKKVTDLATDTVVSLGKGDGKQPKIEGFYLGKRTVETKEGGTSIIHVFQTDRGNVGAWGKADLNNKLSGVKAGTMVLVEFEEKVKLKGGKTMYKFNVMQDSENRTEVGETSYDDTAYADGGEFEDDNYAAERGNPAHDEEYEAPAAPAKRTLDDILKKGKRLA